MIRFASLGSGSRGNALVVETGGTRVLVDCGFSVRETAARLGRIGLIAEGLDAVLVTHEHGDHIGGVCRLATRHRLPVYLTAGTLAQAPAALQASPHINVITAGSAFAIGGLQVQPYSVPHDAGDPVQYVFSDGAARLGVLTDAGHVTDAMLTMLDGLQALVLECNHDVDMLRDGPYPHFLKRRVGGEHGHLANAQAADALARMDRSHLRHIVAAHLSEKNNTPAHARAALADALGCHADWVGVACQQAGFGWREI
ncbi:MAG: MBL fold metallo-hydrolase [Rhodocyclaceae bacterium]